MAIQVYCYRPSLGTIKKPSIDTVSAKMDVYKLRIDRVVYILEKQTQVVLSEKTLRGMLQRYKGERGYLYTGATLHNVPWIFAYMSDATRLFAQKIDGNSELVKAIASQVLGAEISENGRLGTKNVPGSKGPFVDLKMSFIRHRIVKDNEASGLVESMEFVVSQPRRGELVYIHKEVIKFDPDWFEHLIRMPADHPNRRMDRVNVAREELGDLLEPRA